MQYSPEDWIALVIQPSLQCLDRDVGQLGLFLGAVTACPLVQDESKLYGPYQITREQHWSVWDEYIYQDPALASLVRGMASQHRFLQDPELELTLNPGYATVIAAMMMARHCPNLFKTEVKFEQLLASWNQNRVVQCEQDILHHFRHLQRQASQKVA